MGSLSKEVYERRTSTGSGPFSSLDDGFAQIFNQIVSIRVKKLSNTNFISSRHIKREKSSLPFDVRRSKTSLLNNYFTRLVCCKCRTGPDPTLILGCYRVFLKYSGFWGVLGVFQGVPFRFLFIVPDFTNTSLRFAKLLFG